jgi:thiamine biosynthesis lipoprotein
LIAFPFDPMETNAPANMSRARLGPSTGNPASGVHSATVIGPDGVMTDALSTSVFVMGVDQGLRLIATLPGYESIVIDDKGQIYFSDGLMQP